MSTSKSQPGCPADGQTAGPICQQLDERPLTIIYHDLDSSEVHSSRQNLGDDEHPHRALSKCLDSLITLPFALVSMHHIHPHPIHDEGFVQLVGSGNRLDEDE